MDDDRRPEGNDFDVNDDDNEPNGVDEDEQWAILPPGSAIRIDL